MCIRDRLKIVEGLPKEKNSSLNEFIYTLLCNQNLCTLHCKGKVILRSPRTDVRMRMPTLSQLARTVLDLSLIHI